MVDTDAIARGFLAAHDAGEPYVPPSATAALTVDDANSVQRTFVALRSINDKLIGYKAAANAAALQKALNLEGPITGALFASGERPTGCTLQRAEYRNLLIETEIGFRAARRISARVNSLPELRVATTTFAPMIELADPGFARGKMTGTDLIAANSASAGFIRGAPVQVGTFDINAVRVTLQRAGETLHEANSNELLGDQWQALLWLVNRVVELGYVIELGQLLMTGALGPAHPALPGAYVATFSGMGEIAFRVT